ncbi:hypothetical protein Lal_00050041 [Lupinus albus]|nr:hypothetical protein Lal_00050041 [Lupinus albus]
MAAPKLVYSMLTIVACIIIGRSSTNGAPWCTISDFVSPSMLQPQLEYACNHGANCSAIQPGASCYFPNDIYNHAAYAFNSYYVHVGRALGSCYFGGTAKITSVDPSYGSCKYEFSVSPER